MRVTVRPSEAAWRRAPVIEIDCDCGRKLVTCRWQDVPRYCPRCGADMPQEETHD